MKALYKQLRSVMRNPIRSESYWDAHEILAKADLTDSKKRSLLCRVSLSLRDRSGFYLPLEQRVRHLKATGEREHSCVHPIKLGGFVRRPLPR